MRTFMVFRSDITNLEYYHKYKDLTNFINNCHDYYLLFPLWLLKNNYFDQVYIIRLQNKNDNRKDIVFEANGLSVCIFFFWKPVSEKRAVSEPEKKAERISSVRSKRAKNILF